MRTVIVLAVAGVLGTLSRYGLGGLVQKYNGTSFPFGTMIINIIGCFLIGLIMQIALNTDIISPTTRTALTIGFLGAFTTFSTFSYETVKLIEDSALLPAALNIALNVGVGLAATFLGIVLGKAITGGI